MKLLTIFIGTGFIIMSIAVAYYLVIFIPEKERGQQELEDKRLQKEIQQEKREADDRTAKTILLNVCLSEAENNYLSTWNTNCETLGRKENCELPAYRANSVEDYKKQEQENCFRKYPAK